MDAPVYGKINVYYYYRAPFGIVTSCFLSNWRFQKPKHDYQGGNTQVIILDNTQAAIYSRRSGVRLPLMCYCALVLMSCSLIMMRGPFSPFLCRVWRSGLFWYLSTVYCQMVSVSFLNQVLIFMVIINGNVNLSGIRLLETLERLQTQGLDTPVVDPLLACFRFIIFFILRLLNERPA